MTDAGKGHNERDGAPGARRPMPPSIQPSGSGRSAPGAPQRPSTRPQANPAAHGRQRAPRTMHQPAQQQYDHEPVYTAPPPRARKRRGRHRCSKVLVFLLIVLLAAAAVLYFWVDSKIQTVEALSGAADTPGTTYLIVGSDSREGWDTGDPTTGARTDTIMVLHKPQSGPVALISIPRDSYVDIPGHNANKINAAFAFGGAPLLVDTVEAHTGLTIDHYLEVGFTGVVDLVDAVGGVELCYDQNVNDSRSQLVWEAGCHVADGSTALAFARMRYSDPLGDIGRAQRQQQVVGAVAESVLDPGILLNPTESLPLVSAGLDAFRVSEGTGPFGLVGFALAFNSARGGDAVTGTPPIASMGHHVQGAGSTVLLDPDTIDQFWDDIATGAFEPGSEVGGVG